MSGDVLPGPPLPATPHRRLNPLTGEWVLVSPQRDITPETAAAALRELPEERFLGS
jgi:galactose-1-phosphate uridylyltransferase